MGILVVKLIGMFYKIPLVNIIGAQGNTDFTNAYNIYSVLLTISTAGLPVAVSKLVSEADARGRLNQVHKTFRLALIIFLTLGALSFLVMYFRADWLAATMNDTKAAPGIKAMAPAVVRKVTTHFSDRSRISTGPPGPERGPPPPPRRFPPPC